MQRSEYKWNGLSESLFGNTIKVTFPKAPHFFNVHFYLLTLKWEVHSLHSRTSGSVCLLALLRLVRTKCPTGCITVVWSVLIRSAELLHHKSAG